MMNLAHKRRMATHRRIDMDHGPILKNLLLYSVPMMLSGILQLLFNAADIAVAGQYIGEGELAAIGAAGILIALLVNLMIGLSVGVSVSLGRVYGSGQQLTVRREVHTAMILAVVWGAILMVVSIFGAEALLRLMKVPEEIMAPTKRYLQIYACGMIGSALYNFGSAVLRATGDAVRPMWCLAISCALNFALNFLFVRGFGMGLEGVAWATAISLWVMGLLTLLCMMITEGCAQFSFRHLKLHRKSLGIILGLGIPAGLQGIFFPLSNIILQSYINDFGPIVIAGYSAASNVESFVYQAMNGFYHGCMAFVSCNAGAHNWKRVWKVFRTSLYAVAVTGAVLSAGMIAFGRPILGLYSDSPAVIDEGMLRFWCTDVPYLLCGMMEVVIGASRGLGASVRPTVISVLGVCGVRIAWVLAVLPYTNCVETVYVAYPISWAVTLAAQCVLLILVRKKLQKKELAL